MSPSNLKTHQSVIYNRRFFPFRWNVFERARAYIMAIKSSTIVAGCVRPTIIRVSEWVWCMVGNGNEQYTDKTRPSKEFSWRNIQANFTDKFPRAHISWAVKSQQQPTATTTINEQKEEQTRVEKNLSFYYNIYYIIFTFNVEFYSYNIIWNVDASSPSLSLCCSRSRFSTDFSLANERTREGEREIERKKWERWQGKPSDE